MGSAGNSQPWEFLVIRDLGIREKIVEIFKTQMRDKIEIEERRAASAAA
jgi:nitroreductase